MCLASGFASGSGLASCFGLGLAFGYDPVVYVRAGARADLAFQGALLLHRARKARRPLYGQRADRGLYEYELVRPPPLLQELFARDRPLPVEFQREARAVAAREL